MLPSQVSGGRRLHSPLNEPCSLPLISQPEPEPGANPLKAGFFLQCPPPGWASEPVAFLGLDPDTSQAPPGTTQRVCTSSSAPCLSFPLAVQSQWVACPGPPHCGMREAPLELLDWLGGKEPHWQGQSITSAADVCQGSWWEVQHPRTLSWSLPHGGGSQSPLAVLG